MENDELTLAVELEDVESDLEALEELVDGYDVDVVGEKMEDRRRKRRRDDFYLDDV